MKIDKAFLLLVMSASLSIAGLEIAPTPNAPYVVRFGLASSAYQKVVDILSRIGYRLTYVSGYASGSAANDYIR
jgi:hypothetical protein